MKTMWMQNTIQLKQGEWKRVPYHFNRENHETKMVVLGYSNHNKYYKY